MNINFSKINIDNDEARKIATALATHKTVTALDLTSSEIGDDGALALADMLMANETLMNIKISNNKIGNDGAKRMATALATNKFIASLDLMHNNITGDGALALADFKTNNQVVAILLNGHPSDDNDDADSTRMIIIAHQNHQHPGSSPLSVIHFLQHILPTHDESIWHATMYPIPPDF